MSLPAFLQCIKTVGIRGHGAPKSASSAMTIVAGRFGQRLTDVSTP